MLLPDYRGPNPHRALYEGEQRIGATLHWIVEDLDAGPILAQAACEVPPVIDPDTVREAWRATFVTVLTEGVPKAGADEPGLPQPLATTKAATPFTEEEMELDLSLSTRLLEARATALIMSGHQPYAPIGEEVQPVRGLRTLTGLQTLLPGVVRVTNRRAIVGVSDGVVEVEIGKLPY